MEVLLIRHGDPDYANDTLTEKGHEEAEKLSEWLLASPPDVVYTSPLGRAKDTMRHFTDRSGMDFKVLEWIKEVGAPAVEGVAGWELPGTRVLLKKELPNAENWMDEPVLGKIFYPFFKEISAGFDGVMASHGYIREGRAYWVAGPSAKKIVFFAHKGAILTLLAYILDWPVQLVFAHCDISTTGVTRLFLIEDEKNTAVFKMQAMNERRHLGWK